MYCRPLPLTHTEGTPVKRILKIVGLVVLVLVIALAAALLPALFGRRGVTDGVEVNGVRIVKDGMVSVAVVPAGEGKVALIDAGNDKAGQAILAELSRRRLGADAVAAILITHGHPDHVAAIAQFPRAQVMALEAEAALVEGRAGARGPLPRLFPVSPTGVTVNRTLHDGETVTLGPTHIQVFAVPGHTAGSAAYLVNGVLLMGDAADSDRDGNVIGSPWVFSDSQAQDRASLVQLDQRLVRDHADITAIAFAHSGVLNEGLTPLTTFAQANK